MFWSHLDNGFSRWSQYDVVTSILKVGARMLSLLKDQGTHIFRVRVRTHFCNLSLWRSVYFEVKDEKMFPDILA